MHDYDIIHRDLKPSNILIDDNCIVKLADFGSSRIFTKDDKGFTPSVGTKWYKAPELIFGIKDYDKSVDIWSFGCLISELLLLEPLFPGNTDYEMINMIFDFLGYSTDEESALNPNFVFQFRQPEDDIFEKTFDLSDGVILDLIKKMLVVNPAKRLSIDEILEHEYLNNSNLYMEVHLPV